jgi:hypothetical protein
MPGPSTAPPNASWSVPLLTSLLGTLWISCHQSFSVLQSPVKKIRIHNNEKNLSAFTTTSFVENILKLKNSSKMYYLCLFKHITTRFKVLWGHQTVVGVCFSAGGQEENAKDLYWELQ